MEPRILHVVGEGFGGGSVLVRELALAATAEGYQVDVLATDPKFVAYLANDSGIGIIQRDIVRRDIRPGRDLLATHRLRRLVVRNRYHLVHTHTSKGGLVGRLAGWYAHTPIVIHTVHGFPFHEQTHRLPIAALSHLERMAARRCHRVVTVSEFHRAWALRLGIGTAVKVVAIPNGINDDRVQTSLDMQAAREVLGVASSAKVVLTLGRLAPQKGLEELMKAAELMPDPSLVFLIAGDGPLRGELERTCRSRPWGRRFRFLGFESDVSVPLRAADVVALPSLREGLSIALLEAMAAQKPIVTTTIGSNIEATENGVCAILVPPEDPRSLAGALKELLEDKGKSEALAESARARYLQCYTLDRMLNQYMRLYQNPLGELSTP